MSGPAVGWWYLSCLLLAAYAADEVSDEELKAYVAELLAVPLEKRTTTQRELLAMSVRVFSRDHVPSTILDEGGWGDAHWRECRAELEERVRTWRASVKS